MIAAFFESENSSSNRTASGCLPEFTGGQLPGCGSVFYEGSDIFDEKRSFEKTPTAFRKQLFCGRKCVII